MERDYFNITCGSPNALQGRTIPSIIKNGQIADLICNYTSQPVCPPGCSCIEKPDNYSLAKEDIKLILHMNCIGAGLKRLPHILPESEEIEFYLRGNPIEEITKEHYMELITVLDLAFIPTFEMEALENLTHLRVFSIPRSQQLHGIPRKLSFLDPCVFLQRGNFLIDCTCSDLWMYDWIQTKQVRNCTPYIFTCLKEDGEELLTQYLPNLDCRDSDQHPKYIVILSCSSAIVFAFTLFIFAQIWRFDLKVILRSRKMCSKSKKTLDEDCVVYISYDENIKDLNSWLIKRLEPFLRRNELSAFIPSRDLPLGCIRSDETAWQISISRYYIVFLSDHYFDEDSLQTQNDWKCIWDSYLSDSRKELVVINYDLMKTTDIQCKTFQAVMRFGNIVDFASGEKRIFSKMTDRFLY
ncbi:uncharacterized protein LOC133184049 [Saccostrea echinata]|uniref:uncharacterized protein LOC133184049 n=1 Tax=Saccostrea echinata TaxID=191078 RepID=UPI002A80A9B4|nr:uncharacterized protein LOC133184049 [Saccostrea echinata]